MSVNIDGTLGIHSFKIRFVIVTFNNTSYEQGILDIHHMRQQYKAHTKSLQVLLVVHSFSIFCKDFN